MVSWHGNVILSRFLSVSNGSTLNVAGSSDSTDGDSGAAIFSDGTVLLLEVDLGSTVSLTGLTFSGGDGAVRVNGESFVEVIDCSFVDNKITSSDFGGGLTVPLPRIRDRRISTNIRENRPNYVRPKQHSIVSPHYGEFKYERGRFQ